MTRKRKKKTFSAGQAVREMARERVGSVKPARVIPDKRKTKPAKHKPTLGRLLEDQ
ncbi:MAG TPA: hypothetical protein VLT90_04690 [Terriglobales bacterium]|nr:hypothetical protein [Terriglobales bacterium]